ncbi:MAG: fibronectin type III domain-containing protein [Vicinamibacterales bacterium]
MAGFLLVGRAQSTGGLMRGSSGVGVALCVGVLLGGGSAAVAQDTVIVSGRFLSGVRDPGADLGPAPVELTWPLAGGGRFAALGNQVVDLHTGQRHTFSAPGTIIAVDAVRPRVFFRHTAPHQAGIAEIDLRTGASRTLRVLGADEALSPDQVRYAADGDRLFLDLSPAVSSPLTPVPHPVAVIDGTSGALIASFTVSAPSPVAWLVTPEGDRAYVGGVSGFAPGPLTMVNVATGAQATFAPANRPLFWDELNEHLIARGGDGFVLTRDLVPLGQAALPVCVALGTSPHTGRLYVVEALPYTAQDVTRLTVLDSRTFAGLAGRSWPGLACNVTVLSAPGPPRDLRATVSGHDVSLDWVNVGAAAGFVLEAGIAPGRTDLRVFLGPESHTAFTSVPSGTYYLRLRGGNAFGGGRPSVEIRVVVP